MIGLKTAQAIKFRRLTAYDLCNAYRKHAQNKITQQEAFASGIQKQLDEQQMSQRKQMSRFSFFTGFYLHFLNVESILI